MCVEFVVILTFAKGLPLVLSQDHSWCFSRDQGLKSGQPLARQVPSSLLSLNPYLIVSLFACFFFYS